VIFCLVSVKVVFKHFPVEDYPRQTKSSHRGNSGFTLGKLRVPPMGTKSLEGEGDGVAHAPLRARRQTVVVQSADILYMEELENVVDA